mmetsp:Transcript_70367/g.139481  ORF Transcript_70367/g.139481 Transcript_70367/m.139481 type:complete len:504 (-) Transcript_70367:298-1809(-)|eukprot:CAMPEP_0174735436 /NCGR_PEP_ID=MMETSP1094-20130205/64959_1 /TAXON_ID=156173 /ORGANISM="Chrysochromulina brevifilum, Strain UTEX LB 985" /LENGTH=503 /DNA_ID=CAMNT_0015938397 /DNA_START=49 /DNA_END=1560 /DNA_ORIENTATION=+
MATSVPNVAVSPVKIATPSSLDSARRGADEMEQRLQAAKARLDKQEWISKSNDTDPSGAVELPTESAFNAKACYRILLFGNLLTPLDTQAPTPLLPLLLTVDMEKSVETVGAVFSSLTVASLLSFASMLVITKFMSPRRILLWDFAIRFISGALYTAALWVPGGWSGTMPLLYIARFVYGITLNSFALPSIWVGVREPVEERKAKIGGASAVLSMGIVFGPVWGSALASLFPTIWSGYQSTGYFTMIASTVLFLAVYLKFDDDAIMPQAPSAKPTSEAEQTEANRLSYLVNTTGISILLSAMGVMAGFETLLGLAVYDSFHWRSSQALVAWAGFGGSSLLSFMFIQPLLDKFNSAKLVAVGSVLTFLALGQINFFDFGHPTALYAWFGGLLGISPFMIIFILQQSIPATQVPQHQQVMVGAYLQLMSQVGRGVGPIVATTFYSFFTRTFGKEGGTNAASIFMLVCAWSGILLTFTNFTSMYGRWDTLSPKQQREAKESGKAMV